MEKKDLKVLVSAALSFEQLNKMSIFATARAGRDVRVLANNENQCYSYEDYYSGLNIRLGSNFYQDTFKDTDPVPIIDLKEKYQKVASILYGAYYHELFHVLYTPFSYASSLTASSTYYFRTFAHHVANILEDVSIEETGIFKYPFCEKYLLALRDCFQLPYQHEALEKAITDEKDSSSTMLAYLLHYCRGTDLSKFPSYSFWDDNKRFIEESIYKCINTNDAFLRTRRQLAFALQLYKLLDMKEPSTDEVDNPNIDLGSASQSLNEIPKGVNGSKILETLSRLTNTSSYGPNINHKNLSDTEEGLNPPVANKEIKTTLSPTSSDEVPINSDLTKEAIKCIASDETVSSYGHFTDELSKYINTNSFLNDYTRVVNDHEGEIRNVVAIIRKMNAINNASWNHYKMKGKLDYSTFYKKGNYKLFKQKNAPAEAADLVFEILVDLSGSMYGVKAKLAGRALIIFCEALNRLHIPFSVDGFTYGSSSITISLKKYHEPYEKVKTNMTLFTSLFEVKKLSTWCGNVDEVNLKYVSNKLLGQPQKDKVLIVISDGATCGSWKDLKRTAEDIEAQGVTVLGIGIYDDNVKDIYKNHTVITNQNDLESLGDFLNKYLIGKIFK